MDFQYFFKIIWRRKWVLILAVLAAISLTYYLVGLQPPTYKSNAVLSTGITIKNNIKLNNDDPFIQKYEVVSAFSNLIATMKSRTALRLLTYHLLLHDNMPDSFNIRPFRTIQEDAEIHASDRELAAFRTFLFQNRDSFWHIQLNQQQSALLKQLAKASEYDYESIEEKLKIGRIDDTDYLKIEFESENPALSEFAVNAFSREFIQYNKQMVNQDESKAVQFYESLSREKKRKVDQLADQLSEYQMENNIVNLDRQTQSVIDQIKEFESSIEHERKKISGSEKSIDQLEKYLEDYGRQSDTKKDQIKNLNANLLSAVEKIKNIRADELNGEDAYLNRKRLEANNSAKDELISDLVDNLMTNKIDLDATLEDLLKKRIDEEIKLTQAEESVKSLEGRVSEMKENSTMLVEAESYIKMVESQKEMALQEYLQATGKLNDARVMAQSSLYPLSIFEHAQIPEEAEPSKRLLFSAFAGVATGGIFVFVLFFLTLFDNTFSSSSQFEKLANVPLLGTIARLKYKQLDMPKIFNNHFKDRKIESYKESLRKIRNKIEQSQAKRILITSTEEQVGKSFTTLSLAYSLSKKNKKILILDTNFKNNSLTHFTNKELKSNPLYNGHAQYIDFFRATHPEALGKNLKQEFVLNGKVDVIGNWPSGESPSEILAGKQFDTFLNDMDLQYDYILMEGAGLNEYSDSQELAHYADKVIAVFEAQSSLKSSDKDSIEFLTSLDDKFLGAILNQVEFKNLN